MYLKANIQAYACKHTIIYIILMLQLGHNLAQVTTDQLLWPDGIFILKQ